MSLTHSDLVTAVRSLLGLELGLSYLWRDLDFSLSIHHFDGMACGAPRKFTPHVLPLPNFFLTIL